MAELETRRLGRSEMKAKALGLGGGHLAGPEQSDEDAIALIRGAIERGVDLYVTLDVHVDLEFAGLGACKLSGFLDFRDRPVPRVAVSRVA